MTSCTQRGVRTRTRRVRLMQHQATLDAWLHGRGLDRDGGLTGYPTCEALGTALHAVLGYHATPDHDEIEAVLQANPVFAMRCLATPASFFFGPVREMLRAKAVRLRARANLRRFRIIAWCSARLVKKYHAAVERAYTPGGLGYQVAEEEFTAAQAAL